MPHFIRTTPAPEVIGNYSKFRPYVRADFRMCCAYCLIGELFAGGEENYELDHFCPQSLFSERVNDFYNLYYACHVCNNIKRAQWPPQELIDRGIGFVDLCNVDFDQHFQELPDGRWHPLSQSAEYTLRQLRLNRPHLLRLRQFLSGRT